KGGALLGPDPIGRVMRSGFLNRPRRCRNRDRRAEVDAKVGDAKDGRPPDYGGCAG
ncbi:hypothetical protein U1Q18_041538, partial [Sarracenia purpurea var. burkii]